MFNEDRSVEHSCFMGNVKICVEGKRGGGGGRGPSVSLVPSLSDIDINHINRVAKTRRLEEST